MRRGTRNTDERGSEVSNATKAQVIALANALLVLVTSFGVELSDAQTAAIVGALNAGLSLWVGLTFRASTRRIPDTAFDPEA